MKDLPGFKNLAGLMGMVRQYATGKKYPSAEQAKKLEDVIRSLTKELHKVSLYV